MAVLNLTNGRKAESLDSGNMFTSGSDMFAWPVITPGMREGVVKVLEERNMSGTNLTKEFERGFAAWHGRKYALGHNTGTAALHTAMYGLGLGVGDEIICPTVTYWASCVPAINLGASVVFADIDPATLCIDPDDIERRITPRTRAIVVVHYLGHPADMDRIMPIARKHGLKVLEDVSHAHGSLYKGKLVGTFGDAAAYSLMTGKSFAIGESGILITDDRDIYERAVLFGHYERHSELSNPAYIAESGIPLGGFKYRMHQMSSVVGIEMLKVFPALMKEIDAAMNYFWDQLEGTPGIRAHRPPCGSGSTMGAWYAPHGLYDAAGLGGLSVTTFCRAVNAEGITYFNPGCNLPLHPHPLFRTVDVYGDGKPSNFSGPGAEFPVAAGIMERTFNVPWFKKLRTEEIDRYAAAIRKVAEHYEELLPLDEGHPKAYGKWALTPKAGE